MGEIMSGDILSRIQILLDANTANFEQGMQSAERTSISTFDRIKSSAKDMGTVVAAGATSAAIILGSMALETANHASELEKFAFRANTTTQEFQKMAVGAQAYGIEQEKLSDMMKDFNEKMGELSTVGSGGAKDFFEQIAVKTEGSAAAAEKLILKMQKLSGPEALQLYVDKLEKAGVTQQQMSFYLESMASDMTDLIPLLVNGGDGMKLYSDAAERAGLIMSDQTIAQAKILKEQVYLLDLQLQGAKNQLMQAVIPAFVDIAQAFFSGSEQGVQFTDVADGIANTLRYVAKVAIGAATAVQLVGKVIGGLAATAGAILTGNIGQTQAIQDAMVEDLDATLQSAATKLDQISNNTASATAKQMAALRSVEKTTSGVNKGLSELTKKQTEAAGATKKHSQEADKLWRDLERLHEQQARDREQITKAYASDFQNLVWDEAEEIERIRKAGFSSVDQEKYLALAKQRFDVESAEYFKSLNLELNQYKWTEEKKLQYTYEMDREIAANDVKIADEVREAKLRFIDEQYAYELNKINESKRERVNSAMAAWGGTYSDLTGQSEQYAIETQRFSQLDESQELFDAQMTLANTAEEREAIWTAHNDRMLLIDRNYDQSKRELQLASSGALLSNMTDLMASLLGEQSSGYKAMFKVQKAFAIAEILMNAPKSFSKAYDAVVGIPYVGPYLAPVAGGVAIAAQLAQASNLQSIEVEGYATGGLITGEGTGTSDSIPIWASNEEFMIKASSVSKVGKDNLDYINKYGELPSASLRDLKTATDSNIVVKPIININVPSGYKANESIDDNGVVTIDIVKDIARETVQKSWQNLGKSNSHESRQLESYGVARVR